MTTPLCKLSSLASKMGDVSDAEAWFETRSRLDVLEEILCEGVYQGTSPNVTMSDPPAQVFHDTDFSHAASSSECGFGKCEHIVSEAGIDVLRSSWVRIDVFESASS